MHIGQSGRGKYGLIVITLSYVDFDAIEMVTHSEARDIESQPSSLPHHILKRACSPLESSFPTKQFMQKHTKFVHFLHHRMQTAGCAHFIFCAPIEST